VTTFLQATVAGLSLAAIYVLVALGFVIIYKSTRVLSFAQPALLITGAFAISYLAVDRGLGFWPAVGIGVVFTALFAGLVERVSLRPLVGKPVFAAAIATIGLDIAIQVVVADLLGVNIRGVGDPWGMAASTWGGVIVPHRTIAMVVAAMVVVGALGVFYKRSRMGLAMRATAIDQEVALAQGIDVGRVFSTAWMLGGAMAALAGMFSATGLAGLSQVNAVSALKALPAAVVGGLDSIPGAVVGSLIIGLAEAYTAVYQPQHAPWLGANFAQVVPYVVMLIVLLVRPYGLFGTKEVERV
jgi:branched-chain amino acid transport system permease protein